MRPIPSFEDYVASLGQLSIHVDPTAGTSESAAIVQAADSLAALSTVDTTTLTGWVQEHPAWVPALGLTVGLSQEQLKNTLRHAFDSSGWVTLARTRAADLVQLLEAEYGLVRLLTMQRSRTYRFSDVLVARAGTRVTAARAGRAGRRVEDEIEAIARDLGLHYETRTRFTGRNERTAPCDLVVPNSDSATIAVAAKGFDSTGSKLTDAVREIEEMADVRLPRQFIMAVVDGIGWKSRRSDLRRIHRLWERGQIDGLYTLASLGDFRANLAEAAELRGLL